MKKRKEKERKEKASLLSVFIVAVSALFLLHPVQAGRHYVGFSSNPVGATAIYAGDNSGLIAALAATGAQDTVFIAKGLTFYLDGELIVNSHIIGGCNPAEDGMILASRTATGAANSVTSEMTVLDGNSLRRTLRSEKHRVATVNAGGVIENCLIRNGHARRFRDPVPGDRMSYLEGFGGGVLLDGGKLYNCIIRGNVAMSVNEMRPGRGGGVFITSSGGQMVNCIVAFNMDGFGEGIMGEGGEVVNCTVLRNSETPTYVRIESTNPCFQPSGGKDAAMSLLASRYVYLDAFYMATTETTGGQYACFMAAIDYDGTNIPYLKQEDVNAILSAKMPTEVDYKGYPSGITVRDYAIFAGSSTSGCTTPSTSCWNLIQSNADLEYGGCLTDNSNIVWYPNTDKTGVKTTSGERQKRDNYAQSYVSWYGALVFSLWLGGSLPTEAQWEYAARQNADGSTNNTFNYAGANLNYSIDSVAWYSPNSDGRIHEVARKRPTGKGLYDMSGNVYEWVIDEYKNYSNTADTLATKSGKNLVSANVSCTGRDANAPLYNPIAFPSFSSTRVVRGGSWSIGAAGCSLGNRSNNTPSTMNSYTGFRSIVCP